MVAQVSKEEYHQRLNRAATTNPGLLAAIQGAANQKREAKAAEEEEARNAAEKEAQELAENTAEEEAAQKAAEKKAVEAAKKAAKKAAEKAADQAAEEENEAIFLAAERKLAEMATAKEAAQQAKIIFHSADTAEGGNNSLSHGELKKRIQQDPALRERLSANKWKVFFQEIDADGLCCCFWGVAMTVHMHR